MSPSSVKFLTQLLELLEHFGIDHVVWVPPGVPMLGGLQDRKQESVECSKVSETAALVREETVEDEAYDAASYKS